MAEITKELLDNQTILLLIPSKSFNKVEVDTAKKLSKGKVCYITLGKTYQSFHEIFQKKKIKQENFVFIDAITQSIKGKQKEVSNCFFVSNPGALTELSLVITKFLKYEFDYIVLDSLPNLCIYRDDKTIEKFILNLINKIKESKTKLVIYSTDIKDQDGVIKQTSLFVDKVVKTK
jgi:hypothetical protein